MRELHALWATSEKKPSDFFSRVQIHVSEGLSLARPAEKSPYSKYWLSQKNELDKLIAKGTIRALGKRGTQEYWLICEFVDHTYDVLSMVADHIHSKSLDDLIAAGALDA